jgi:hypothetical protein
MTQEREAKRQLRALRKLKRQTQIHTEERRQINRQIRELRKQSQRRDEELKPSVLKQSLIDELTKVYKMFHRPILVDFRIYSEEQLGVHLQLMVKHNVKGDR